MNTQASGELPGPKPELAAFRALSRPEIIARYAIGVENFPREILALAPEQLDMAFLPDAGVGRWPIRVLLGHVADADLVYTHRFRRTIGEDHPVLGVWDENAFVDSGLYGSDKTPVTQRPSVGGFIAAIHTLRRWTSEWLGTLDDAAFQRTAMHPERGEETLRFMVDLATFHLEHHNWFLKAKLEKFKGR